MTLDKPVAVVMTCTSCNSEYPDGTFSCPRCGTDLVAQSDPLVGTLFDRRYQILERIGKGGMGVVYKAHHKDIDQVVAIKILYKQYSTDQASIDRFKQEANTLVALKHPNILIVHDFGMTPEEQPFLIMEYLEGTTLAEFLEQHGRMPIERALNVFVQACDGLAHAHEKGVIHRDLKPGNLMLIKEPGKREEVKIVDFGIAKIKPRDGKEPQNLTKAGEIFGSPLYMSPEQCQGKSLDERSDIYSFGCVIYETLTSMPPLMGINSFETMTKHVNELPLPMRGAAPELAIPDLIDAAVIKSMSKDPAKRQHSVKELKKDLVDGARSSAIYFETEDKPYMPKSFATGQFDAVASADSDPDLDRYTAKEQHEKDKKEKEELQKLVEDAVLLAQKQDTRTKELRQMLIVFYCLLGFLVFGGFIYFTMPGPKEDPAPNWQKQAWRWAMDAGDKSAQIGQFDEAIADYRKAEKIGQEMGPIYDKQIKALLQLLLVYKKLNNAEGIKDVQKNLFLDLSEREKRLYGEDTPDLNEVRDLDGGLISAGIINPQNLDPALADRYSHTLIENAKECYDKKKYKKAESWLRSAIDLEERAHGQSKGELTKTARDFADRATPEERAHMQGIDELIKRAEAAEAGK